MATIRTRSCSSTHKVCILLKGQQHKTVFCCFQSC
jgi:hypothetical protein